jgi:hypothetical protein
MPNEEGCDGAQRPDEDTSLEIGTMVPPHASVHEGVDCKARVGHHMLLQSRDKFAVVQDSNRPISDALHPIINAGIVGLVFLYVLSAWTFFAGDRYEAWLDVVVTVLFTVAIGTPLILWLTWRRHDDHARDESRPRMRDWMAGEFDTSTGRVAGRNAMAEVLLPIGAVAVGMMVLGLVYHVIASGAA